MSIAQIITLGLLPAFLFLDYFNSPPKGVRIRWWRTRAFVVTVFNFWFAMLVGRAWGAFAGGFHVFNGAALGVAGGAVVGVLVYQFFHYWYHRSAHRFSPLWRLGHQMHHSPESLDAWGAYFLHPLDVAFFTSISSLVLFPLLGLQAEAGAWAAAALTFLGVFEHANLRTPRWLGWFIQRPESHAIHHQRGVHAFNYADLPLWDWVFGTLNNPKPMQTPLQGFHPGASARIAEMLAFRDVSEPRAR